MEQVRLDNREDLLKALNSDEEFLEFWNFIQDQHPMKTDYFESLVNEEEPYNPGWIKDEYVEWELSLSLVNNVAVKPIACLGIRSEKRFKR